MMKVIFALEKEADNRDKRRHHRIVKWIMSKRLE